MKITGMTIRILAIDAGPRYGARGVPKGQPTTWHYPLIIVHTDEGVDGYTMGYGNQGDGRAIARLLQDVYFSKIIGENPLHIESLWQKLRHLQRHLYALSDALLGLLDVAFWDCTRPE